MYDKDAIITCGSGLVGWEQSSDPSHTILTPALVLSTSGFYVNSLPGVDFNLIEEMFSSQRHPNRTNYLENIHNQELIKLVNRTVSRQKQELKTKELLSNFDPIAGRASFADKITQNGRFVGYMIMPHNSNNLRADIKYIGMQIDTVQTTPVRVYLYETSQREPIATYDFQNTDTYSLEWRAVEDFIINYRSSVGGTGQTFLLGYYEEDTTNPQHTQLEGQAVYVRLCSGCGADVRRRALYQKYIGITPIEIPNSALNWNGTEYDLPDSDSLVNYTVSYTHGLLIKFNITCDITDVICQNIQMFAEPLQYAIAVRVMYDLLNYTGHNATADSKRNRDNLTNFAKKYEGRLFGFLLEGGKWSRGMIDDVVMDLSNIDQFCLPCKQTKPVIGFVSR